MIPMMMTKVTNPIFLLKIDVKVFSLQGQAFYAGGSERSGQQILGPPKRQDTDKQVTKVFDNARKQGATEVQENESRSKQEKPFTGTGYSLGDENLPSRTQGQQPPPQAAAASNTVEQLPLRFYSNGFTVGDGDLRKFEDNKEFMEYIKRGEVPPELRNMNTNGRQVEVKNKNIYLVFFFIENI